jgi:hypothetical protein
MQYEWLGPGVLTRVGGDDVHPGEEFSPTDAERRSFADAMEEVEDDGTDTDDAEDTTESGAEDTALADKHWRTAVTEVENGEHDDRLDKLDGSDDLTDAVQEAVTERLAELSD